MLQFISDLPDHVVGILATGEVNKNDYEKVLIPRMKEFVKLEGQINYLLVLETDIQNFSAAAWWEDFKLGLKNFTKWKKVAVVTDQNGGEWFSDPFRHFISGDSRGYKLSALEDAIRWVSESILDHEHETISAEEVLGEIRARSSNMGQGPSVENL